jgi:hypothetical protein
MRRNSMCLAIAVVMAVLAGCGAPTVDVVLPEQSKTTTASSATCRGVVAGKVTTVSAAAPSVATVELDSSDIAKIVLRDGVQAFVLDSGDVEFDVSGVQEGAKALPSGSKIVATRRNAVEAAISRWATGWNITVVIVGLVTMLLLVALARTLVRGVAGMARIALALAVSGAIAYFVAPPLAPQIERHVYPRLEAARGKADPAATSTQTPAQPSDSSGPEDKARSDLRELASAASDKLGEWGQKTAEILKSRPLPNPVYPAFFGVWLVGFLIAASLLRGSTRSE